MLYYNQFFRVGMGNDVALLKQNSNGNYNSSRMNKLQKLQSITDIQQKNQVVKTIFNMARNQKCFGLSEQEAEALYLESNRQMNQFFQILQEKFSRLYLGMSKMIIEKLNQKQMTENQAYIYFAEEIISTSLNIFKIIGEASDYHFEDGISQKFNDLQISMIKYVKMIYPRGNKSYVPEELMVQFKNIDMVEQPQFDALRSAGIYFGSQEDKDIIMKLKEMINKFIDETDKYYPTFVNLLQNQIFSLDKNGQKQSLEFQSSRKISEQVSKLHEKNPSLDEIKSPEIFVIILDWLTDIQDYLLDPSEELLEKDYFKFIVSENSLEYRDISPEEIENLIGTLQSELITHKQDYQNYLKGLKMDLEAFNRNLIKLVTLSDRNQKYVSKRDAQIIKYSVSNTKILYWMVMEKLITVIKKLVSAGQSIETVLGMKMDLIKCNITDIISAEATAQKKEFIAIFRNMKRLEEQDVIKIIRIKNNLGTALNNVTIAFKMSLSFIICEISLILAESDQSSGKYKNVEFLNTFYDELSQSPDGVIYQLAILIGNRHKIVEYQDKLTFTTKQINVQLCKQSHKQCLIEQEVRRKPFVCTKCTRYYNVYENKFIFYHCEKCGFFLCSRCIINHKVEQYKYCMKQIKKKITDQMVRLEKLQQFYLRKADVDDKKNAFDLSGERAIVHALVYFHQYKEFKFLRDIVPNKNVISIQILGDQITKSYATVGLFKGSKLFLYSLCMKQRKTKKTYKFSFDNWELNQVMNINFGHWDFVIYHDNFVNGQNSIVAKQLSQIPEHKILCLYQNSNEMYKNAEGKIKFEAAENVFQQNQKQGQKVNNFFICMDLKNDQDQSYTMISNADTKLGTIHNIRKYLPEVQHNQEVYNLQDNQLQDHHLEYFREFQWKNLIKVLNLKDNCLHNIDVILAELPNIEKLVVSNNSIYGINFTHSLPHLVKFNAARNQITQIQSIGNIPNIVNLNFKSNSLSNFQRVKMPHLKNLDLSNNELQSIENLTSDFYPSLSVVFISFYLYNMQSFEIRLPALKNLEIIKGHFEKLHINQSDFIERIKMQGCQINSLKIQDPSKLKILDLQSSTVANLGDLLVKEYPHIIELLIQQNSQIFNLPEIKSHNLKKLLINSTSISNIKDFALTELSKLKIINLSSNLITVLPHFNGPELQEFEILNNQLEDIMELSQWNTPKLEVLRIGKINPKTTIVNLGKLALKRLQIVGGTVNGLEIINCTTLLELNLSLTTGNNLPILVMPQLKQIRINNCSFADIVNLSVSTLQNIEIFQITDSVTCPGSFPKLMSTQKLKTLTITGNNFTDINCIQKMNLPKLTELFAGYNKITNLPIFKNTPKLTQLSLSENELTCANNLQYSTLESLSRLTLSCNKKLSNFPELKQSKIVFLDLSDCGFIDLPWILTSEFPLLQQLYIPDNAISSLHRLSQQQSKPLQNLPIVNLPKLDVFDYTFERVMNIKALQFLQFQNLKSFQLVEIQLHDSTLPILRFPSLTQLTISETNISNITSLQFSELPSLANLTINKNKITKLPKVNMPKLTTLIANFRAEQTNDSNYQKLQNVDQFFTSNLIELKRIQLEENDLTSLPKMNLPKLEQIFIHKNRISNLDEFILSNLPKVNLINLCENPINRLPFGKRVKPTEVYMQGGKVEDFSPLGEASIYISRLHYNQSVIPNNLPGVNFAVANRVQFQSCQLVNIDHFFNGPYPQVEQISFINNKIVKAPKVRCPKLKRLFFNKNKIKDVSQFMSSSDLSGVQMLSLENNEIQDLVDLPFTNPTEIFLSHNFFTDISFMSRYKYHSLTMFVAFNVKISKICKFNTPVMTKLYLNTNQIEDITPLGDSNFPALELLQLADNRIRDISPIKIMKSSSLNAIYLMNNKIEKLVSLKDLYYLYTLNVDGNPVKDFNQFLLQKNETLQTLKISLSCESDEDYQNLSDKLTNVYDGADISRKFS